VVSLAAAPHDATEVTPCSKRFGPRLWTTEVLMLAQYIELALAAVSVVLTVIMLLQGR